MKGERVVAREEEARPCAETRFDTLRVASDVAR